VLPPLPIGGGSGPPPDAREGGAAPDQHRNYPKPSPIHIIGDAPAETCLHCRQTGDVKRIVNAAEVGGKSEMLHEGCAAEWFAKLSHEP
jgi:hypothetical protein